MDGIEKLTKLCPCCKIEKPLSDYHKAKERRLGVRTYCRSCQASKFKINYDNNRDNWIKRSSASTRKHNLKRKYKLSLEDYDKLVAQQENKCAICGSQTNKQLAVDHNHITGEVRSLLCHKCNMGLGCYNENIELFTKAINYIRKFNGPSSETVK